MIDHEILFRTFHILYITIGGAVALYLLYLLFQAIDRVIKGRKIKINRKDAQHSYNQLITSMVNLIEISEKAKWQRAIRMMVKKGVIR